MPAQRQSASFGSRSRKRRRTAVIPAPPVHLCPSGIDPRVKPEGDDEISGREQAAQRRHAIMRSGNRSDTTGLRPFHKFLPASSPSGSTRGSMPERFGSAPPVRDRLRSLRVTEQGSPPTPSKLSPANYLMERANAADLFRNFFPSSPSGSTRGSMPERFGSVPALQDRLQEAAHHRCRKRAIRATQTSRSGSPLHHAPHGPPPPLCGGGSGRRGSDTLCPAVFPEGFLMERFPIE